MRQRAFQAITTPYPNVLMRKRRAYARRQMNCRMDRSGRALSARLVKRKQPSP
jgi:hypothetical protein